MKLRSLISGLGLTSMVVGLAFAFTSCTPKITEEQLATLKTLYDKEKSMNETIAKKNAEKKKLEQEINSRKAILQKCEEEKAFIQSKLATWPDCWPDWKPEATAEPETK